MSTVARIEPRGMPSASWAWTKTSFQSRASWCDSSLARYRYGPLPRSSALGAEWNRYSPTSNSEAETGTPSTSTCDSTRCQPRGRTTSVRRGRPAGTTCPRASRRSSVPRSASAIAAWPPTTFAQVGDSASSRSAMNTRAPEFRALIIIFGSAGPVISTRRSSRSAGAGRDGPVGLADVARRRPGSRAGRRRRARPGVPGGVEEVEPDRPEPALEVGDEGERVVGQDPRPPPRDHVGPVTLDAVRQRRRRQASPRRTVASISPCGSVVGV